MSELLLLSFAGFLLGFDLLATLSGLSASFGSSIDDSEDDFRPFPRFIVLSSFFSDLLLPLLFDSLLFFFFFDFAFFLDLDDLWCPVSECRYQYQAPR